MRTVQNSSKLNIKVTKGELFSGKWLHFQLLSKKVGEAEKADNMAYKNLRNRLYNSRSCGKYNMKEIAGLTCIDVKNPMKGEASLELSFEIVE